MKQKHSWSVTPAPNMAAALFTRRIYRQFVCGWSRIGMMQILTSSGVGISGPPLRPGSNPEIVILQFE